MCETKLRVNKIKQIVNNYKNVKTIIKGIKINCKGIKGYISMSEDELLSALDESESVKENQEDSIDTESI